MKEYTGAVFFVDILGVGALTQGKINITEEDFLAHEFKYEPGFSEHQFCANLLSKFRKILSVATRNIKNVKVAQLSDCAFIWSPEPDIVVNVARDIMWKSMLSGVLCRGGIANGQIVEPEKINSKLGKFICGGAVTEAVKLESMGKGARVFIKPELVSELNKISPYAFTVRESPIDFSIVDEFLWYKYPKNIQSTFDSCNEKHVLIGLIQLIAAIKYSPKFRWNALSDEGQRQLASTLDVISYETESFTPNLDLRFSFEYSFKYLDIDRRDNIHQKVLNSYLNEYRNSQNASTKHKKNKGDDHNETE